MDASFLLLYIEWLRYSPMSFSQAFLGPITVVVTIVDHIDDAHLGDGGGAYSSPAAVVAVDIKR